MRSRISLYTWTLVTGSFAVSIAIIFYFYDYKKHALTLPIIITFLATGVVVLAQVVWLVWSNYRRQQVSDRIYSPRPLRATVTLGPEQNAPGQVVSSTLEAEDRRVREYTSPLAEAESQLGKHLPANPRRAKRIVNHWRLYLAIARNRDVFGGTPDIAYVHLVRWLLLGDRWPALAASLTRDPARMAALEAASTIAQLRKAATDMMPTAAVTKELQDFLKEAPSLAPVLARLVRFQAPPHADAQAALASADPDADDEAPATPATPATDAETTHEAVKA